MYEYHVFLWGFIRIFAIIYVLVYISRILRNKPLVRQNIVFVVSFILSGIFFKSLIMTNAHFSFIVALSVIWVVFNIYLLLPHAIKKRIILLVLIDFIVCASALFLSQCIVAVIDNLPIKHIILYEVEGGHAFKPGYLQDMIRESIVFSFMIVCAKYFFLLLVKEWEKRQNRKFKKLMTEKENIKSQFDSLQAKVNPHFLYNSLNSIAGLATVDGDKTRQMALALSRFFRYNMNSGQKMMIRVKEEAEMIKTYLEIEKIRFGDKLNYRIDLPVEAESFTLPRMLLQPIVENCIKHGLKGECESLEINISFILSDDGFIISIKDDGQAFPDDFLPGYGIQSVYDKLDLVYPNKYKVELITFPGKDFRIYLH